MRVEYIDNNGYVVETKRAVYIFNYVEGLLPAAYLRSDKPLMFFVSNAGQEYYSQSVFAYKKSVIYSHDVPQDPVNKVFKMFPGDMVHLGYAKVYAHGSNRDGLIYVVEEEDFTIVCAGSFNNWHYQETSSLKRVEMETAYFLDVLKSIQDVSPVDILIFPVNPDMGYNYDYGARKAVARLKPRFFFPTQFKRRELISEFERWAHAGSGTQFFFPKYTNQRFEVNND